MFDHDGSSTIEFKEFRELWSYVSEWEKCFRFDHRKRFSFSTIVLFVFFRQFDLDGSGTIDKHELKTALSSFGMCDEVIGVGPLDPSSCMLN